MDVERLDSIVELVAAIATIITLFYLAVQIRQSANATKAQQLSTIYLLNRMRIFVKHLF